MASEGPELLDTCQSKTFSNRPVNLLSRMLMELKINMKEVWLSNLHHQLQAQTSCGGVLFSSLRLHVNKRQESHSLWTIYPTYRTMMKYTSIIIHNTTINKVLNCILQPILIVIASFFRFKMLTFNNLWKYLRTKWTKWVKCLSKKTKRIKYMLIIQYIMESINSSKQKYQIVNQTLKINRNLDKA